MKKERKMRKKKSENKIEKKRENGHGLKRWKKRKKRWAKGKIGRGRKEEKKV
jgi:hypothetical protein